MKTRANAFFAFVLVGALFCLSLAGPGWAQNGNDEEKDEEVEDIEVENFLKRAKNKREKKLIIAMRKLAARKEKAAVPVLYELFQTTKRSTKCQLGISPVRGALVRAIIAIGGADARDSLKEILSVYLRDGSLSSEPHYPYDDREYAWIMVVAFEGILRFADKSLETWFLKVSDTRRYEYSIREDAYTGYLKAKLDRLKPRAVNEAVMLILPNLSSPGGGEWDYFHSPIKETDPDGKKDWAIKDTARCRALIEQGPPALPLLWKKYQEFAARKKLSKAEKRKQYGIAKVINGISGKHNLPDYPLLERRPKSWKEDWLKHLKEYQEKVRRYRQSQQKKK